MPTPPTPTRASDASDRRATVQDLTNARLRALAEHSEGQAQHSPPQQSERNGQCEMRCFGIDEPNGIRFAFVVRAASDRVVTVALTRYFLDEIGAQFEAYSGVIFDHLELMLAEPTYRATPVWPPERMR